MIRALYTAASGMNAQQTNIDNTAHNLANVNTTGFKKARVEFEDLVYQQVRGAGAPIPFLRNSSSFASWLEACLRTPSASQPLQS